ncbi:uncharacterized protein LOC130858400 [Hippopotamus amphibius kiboko]|uniref:uncharacterized protein LOC130858400 n=1 Tax=Hippopotamus amphibius kiboko TaxID=575201 RepID=UPI002597148E|nr:uncharacterized protein LOC130858400 [Hippopotamus amphibius kiboko]
MDSAPPCPGTAPARSSRAAGPGHSGGGQGPGVSAHPSPHPWFGLQAAGGSSAELCPPQTHAAESAGCSETKRTTVGVPTRWGSSGRSPRASAHQRLGMEGEAPARPPSRNASGQPPIRAGRARSDQRSIARVHLEAGPGPPKGTTREKGVSGTHSPPSSSCQSIGPQGMNSNRLPWGTIYLLPHSQQAEGTVWAGLCHSPAQRLPPCPAASHSSTGGREAAGEGVSWKMSSRPSEKHSLAGIETTSPRLGSL